MNSLFHISNNDELYEISMRESTIVRISRYNTHDSRRTDIEFDHLSLEVQNKIISKAKQILER